MWNERGVDGRRDLYPCERKKGGRIEGKIHHPAPLQRV
jgi:hypothetical protein